MRLFRPIVIGLFLAVAAAACDSVGNGDAGSDDDATADGAATASTADGAAGSASDSVAAGSPGRSTSAGVAASAGSPPYGEIRSELCDTLRNSFDCARAIERAQLPDAPDVYRSGDTLRIALAGGDTTRYVDQPGEHADVIYYSYQTRWPGAGFHLIQVQYYEGSAFLLVGDSTGGETRLADWPVRAPDGQRFVVASLDLVAGYGPNTLQVWTLEEGAPEREWETEPSQWGPTDIEWTGPEAFRLTQHGYCDQLGGSGRGMCDRPARAWIEAGEWRIESTGQARER